MLYSNIFNNLVFTTDFAITLFFILENFSINECNTIVQIHFVEILFNIYIDWNRVYSEPNIKFCSHN